MVKRGKAISLNIFIGVWIVFATFLNAFYESNLRAYIIKIDYTKPVDSAKDLLDADIDLYLTVESGLLGSFEVSLNPHIRQAGKNVLQRGTFFNFTANGSFPWLLADKILKEGE